MDRRQFTEMIMARHFIGDAFEDALFHTDNQTRELACSWKIQSYLPLFGPLTSHSWAWRAVGIPLNLLGGSIEGDIDLMFAVRPRPSPPVLYRCFELKTSKVKLSGEVKALKTDKFRKKP